MVCFACVSGCVVLVVLMPLGCREGEQQQIDNNAFGPDFVRTTERVKNAYMLVYNRVNPIATLPSQQVSYCCTPFVAFHFFCLPLPRNVCQSHISRVFRCGHSSLSLPFPTRCHPWRTVPPGIYR